jgi:hypothetical protein
MYENPQAQAWQGLASDLVQVSDLLAQGAKGAHERGYALQGDALQTLATVVVSFAWCASMSADREELESMVPDA